MRKSKIAILGSTSHIAKGLINNFFRNNGFDLHLYTRSPENLRTFICTLDTYKKPSYVVHQDYSNLKQYSYDVIINCIGVGTWKRLGGDYSRYFTIPEKYDNLVIDYLQNRRQDTLYISFSSGAVYGTHFSAPVKEDTVTRIQVNKISPKEYYCITRIYTESKHRAFDRFRIADLRVFSYFSRFIDLNEGYFISEIINCILNRRIFKTNDTNIVRDYVHPEDLFSLILKCINMEKVNTALDVTSAKPAKKSEILDFFSSQYGLQYQVDKSLNHISATGIKDIYYSEHNNALQIGYKPKFTSMDTIKKESACILNGLT